VPPDPVSLSVLCRKLAQGRHTSAALNFYRLGTEIIKDFILIDPETQPRNVAAWTPVVTDIIRGAIDFEDGAFEAHLGVLYPLIVDLLGKDIQPEMRLSVRDYLRKVGEVKGFGREAEAAATAAVTA
jgi:brefeldin A-inhibited guanine nucleotide-exchange protein